MPNTKYNIEMPRTDLMKQTQEENTGIKWDCFLSPGRQDHLYSQFNLHNSDSPNCNIKE